MDYAATYCALISKRLHNPLNKKDCYCETHHIIPKSEGGKDEPDNLVNLTAREHYIAHLLLWKIYKDYRMANAVVMFRSGSKTTKRDTKVVNSRVYQKAKEFAAKRQSEIYRGENHPWFGRHHSEETKMKLRRPKTIEHRMKLSLAMIGKGHPHTDEDRMKISMALKGKAKSSEHVLHNRQAKIRVQGHAVCQYDMNGGLIVTYPAMALAASALGVSRQAITRCCRGLLSNVKGFVFKYAEINEDMK